MEPEIRQDTSSSDFAADEIKVEIDAEDSGQLSSVSSTTEPNEQWRDLADRASRLLSELPEYLSEFFGEYRRPIVTIGLIVGSVIAVKLTLAILESVNEIPLLAPTFELIGLGYSAWFIYRYLLRASNRKELANDFNSLKEQILGQNNSKV